MTEEEFQLWKAVAVVLALVAAAFTQHVFPYRGDRRAILANWRVNVPLAVLNAALVSLVCQGCACLVATWADERGFGLLNLMRAPLGLRIAAAIVVLDFVAYAWHRANHRFPLLWRFHALHHSDKVFDASTAVRFHPIEILVSLVVRVLVVAALGLPVLGILLFEIVFAAFNFFEHGDIRLARGLETALDRAVVTPALHRKHHTAHGPDFDRNFGTILTVWDRVFGTYAPSSSREVIEVGLPQRQ